MESASENKTLDVYIINELSDVMLVGRSGPVGGSTREGRDHSDQQGPVRKTTVEQSVVILLVGGRNQKGSCNITLDHGGFFSHPPSSDQVITPTPLPSTPPLTPR